MSKISDILDGKQANIENIRNGLIYTRRCGWIDLGHARPDNAKILWNKINDGNTKKNSCYEIEHSQSMEITKFKATLETGITRRYYIKTGLTDSEMKSVSISIFLEISNYFENYQASFVFKLATDSGFSAEDLVSNLIGFYRAVEPGKNYITLCEPVSYEDARYVWDNFGPVGSNKNNSPSPYLYPTRLEFTEGPRCGQLPGFLTTITPAKSGVLFGDWDVNGYNHWIDININKYRK